MGSGGGASVIGKGVGVSVASATVFSGAGVATSARTGAEGDGSISCGADVWLVVGAHPDKRMNATGKKVRRWFMVYWLDEMSVLMWVSGLM